MDFAQYLNRQIPLAIDREVENSNMVGWVGIYPLDPTRDNVEALFERFKVTLPSIYCKVYRIRVFEIPNDYDESHWLAEEDLFNKSDYFACSISEVEEILQRLCVDSASFKPQGQTSYPI